MKSHRLEVDSVQKRFGNKLIVSDVWLACETKEIIGLLGRNGSGKSTLLKIIFGIIPADFKFIRIDGVPKNSTAELLHDIGYLHQDNFIPKHLSVTKAIALTIPNEDREGFYNDEMIASIRDRKISHLSGGELRYLEIKLILAKPSKFTLLDEPYNGLSPMMVEKINALIRQNSVNRGIIITDHNYENIIEIATKLILMQHGKTHQIKDKTELVDKGYLKEGMI